jgi:putative nucleotidyltransferase with HDIG domain
MQASEDTILIVDDEPDVRSVLLAHLSETGSACMTSDSAFDAISKLRERPFSLIIGDMMMPGMSGMELLQFVNEHHPETAFIMMTGLTDIHTAVDSLRIGACDLLAMRRAVDSALERRRLLIENRTHREELEQKVRERTSELNEALHDVEESYNITLEALVTALDAREHETHAHSQRVKEYALTLARELGLRHDDLIQTGRGALLHDVGKIGVPDSILLKPGKLNEQEWVEMKKHPQIGYTILKNIEFLSPSAEIVLCHHERWDGKGYPYGLAGLDIPLGARIFAVVDTLDAMTSDRPYRKALSFEAAFKEIRSCAGTQFDPRVADAFLSITPESWKEIHDSVNRLHPNQDYFDFICPSSNTSQ